MTATFFNAKYIKNTLVEGTRVMLSGEVGFFKGTMQLTHPAFLILDADGPSRPDEVAEEDRRGDTGRPTASSLSVFERDFFPIYPASAKLQSWDIYACVRQVLDVLDPIDEPLPESFLREHNLIVRGRGAACHPHRGECRGTRRARSSVCFRRGHRAAVGAGASAVRRAQRDRPARAASGRRSGRGDARAVAVRTDRRPEGGARRADRRVGGDAGR